MPLLKGALTLALALLAVALAAEAENPPQDGWLQIQALKKFVGLSLLASQTGGEELGDVWSNCSKG